MYVALFLTIAFLPVAGYNIYDTEKEVHDTESMTST